MLTEKKKVFCREYVVDFNGAAAAARAGYSKNRARITASEFLADEAIIAEVARLVEERNVTTDLQAGDVINELRTIAFSRTTDFVKVKEIKQRVGKTYKKTRIAYIELTEHIDPEKQAAIAEIKQTKEGIALKSHDKVKALELLGKHLGIFEKDNKQKKPEVNLGNLPVTFE